MRQKFIERDDHCMSALNRRFKSTTTTTPSCSKTLYRYKLYQLQQLFLTEILTFSWFCCPIGVFRKLLSSYSQLVVMNHSNCFEKNTFLAKLQGAFCSESYLANVPPPSFLQRNLRCLAKFFFLPSSRSPYYILFAKTMPSFIHYVMQKLPDSCKLANEVWLALLQYYAAKTSWSCSIYNTW